MKLSYIKYLFFYSSLNDSTINNNRYFIFDYEMVKISIIYKKKNTIITIFEK